MPHPETNIHESSPFASALARRLTELHDGSLSAASEGAGRGSEFTLRVPLDR